MKYCPACGLSYKEEVQFCPSDGTKLSDCKEKGVSSGQILAGSYEIKAEVVSTGFWKIYMAEEIATGRSVVIKTTSVLMQQSYSQESLETLIKEWQKLSHPGLIKILNYGKTPDGLFYVVAEYVEGESLKNLIQNVGSLSIALSLSIIEQILKVMHYIHQNGLLYLDLSPSQIFLVKSATGPHFVKISGLGRLTPVSESIEINADAQFAMNQEGTNYTAPEVFQGRKPDCRADIYSVGIILYEMISGIWPFPAGSLVHYKTSPTVPSIGKIKPSLRVPGALEKTIIKSIKWDPSYRFADANAFLNALQGAKSGRMFPNVACFVFILTILYFVYNYDWTLSLIQRGVNFISSPASENKEIKPTIQKPASRDTFVEEFQQKFEALAKNSSKERKKDYTNMAYIDGGDTYIGDKEGEQDEQKVKIVKIIPFYMDQTEVTNADYQLFVNNTGHKSPDYWNKNRYPPEKSQYPVVNVNWYDATLYAAWLRKRLPSEMEWERASHGPGKDEKNLKWPWGNMFFKGFSNVESDTILPVGQFPQGKSLFGIQDMAGNVWEWTDTWYDLEVKKDKVIKGGSYHTSRWQARTTYRDGFSPRYGRNDIGFRCVKEVE